MSLKWVPHVTVAAVILRDDRFLLVEEEVGGRRVLNQPAGHLEDDETVVDAVVREVREETGLVFTPQAIVGFYQWRHPEKAETFLRMTFCGTVSGECSPQDPAILDLHWLDAEAVRTSTLPPRSPLVLRAIDDYLDGHRFPLRVIADL